MSELDRPGKTVCFSICIEGVFEFAEDAFNILDIDGFSTLLCLINPRGFTLIGMKLFLLEVHADLASNSIRPLIDFDRLSHCISSEDFLDIYPSDDVSSNESYRSLVLFMRSVCAS